MLPPQNLSASIFPGSMAVTSLHLVILNHGPNRTTSRHLVPTAVGPGGIFSMAATGDSGGCTDS
jgi:hypothetical protein